MKMEHFSVAYVILFFLLNLKSERSHHLTVSLSRLNTILPMWSFFCIIFVALPNYLLHGLLSVSLLLLFIGIYISSVCWKCLPIAQAWPINQRLIKESLMNKEFFNNAPITTELLEDVSILCRTFNIVHIFCKTSHYIF